MLCNKCSSSMVDDLHAAQDIVSKNISRHQTVASLEAELSQIDSMIEGLTNRRIMLRRRINTMSSTAQVPPEILTEIFRLASHNCEEGRRPVTPLFFGRICREWRDIAWSTPLLWNNITLRISRTTFKLQAHLLNDWLLRARMSPLFIKLTADDDHESTYCSLHSVINILATRSKYWYNFSSLLPLQCHDILVDNHFPMLESVSLHPPKGTISTFNHPPNMFLSAPKLRDIDLSGYNFSAMVLPWAQLRRFKSQFLTVEECLKILQRSPDLKHCHLESVYSPDLFPASITNPLQSHLESLDVALIKPGAISLLESITLPSLREIRIHCSGRPGSLILPEIASLITRSSCNLQLLHIEKLDFHEDDLISCLQKMPSISHLRLVALGDNTDPSTGLTYKFMEMMHPTYFNAHPMLLPNLVYLEYHGRVRCHESFLTTVLSARWQVQERGPSDPETKHLRAARLGAVNIISPTPFNFSADSQREVKRLENEGMRLDIRSIESPI